MAGQMDDIQGVFDDSLGLKDVIEDTLKVFSITCSIKHSFYVFILKKDLFLHRTKLSQEEMKKNWDFKELLMLKF